MSVDSFDVYHCRHVIIQLKNKMELEKSPDRDICAMDNLQAW